MGKKGVTKPISFNGKKGGYAFWAKETGITASTIRKRIELGWSVSDALTKTTKARLDRIVTIGNDQYPVKEAAEILNITVSAVYDRIRMKDEYENRKKPARSAEALQEITAFGKTQPIIEFSHQYLIPPVTVRQRLKLGWSPERALTAPVCLVSGRKRSAWWDKPIEVMTGEDYALSNMIKSLQGRNLSDEEIMDECMHRINNQ